MYWYPKSFFVRTLWMVLLAILFSKALTLVYLMMNEDVLVDRQYSHGAALTLRAYWAAHPNDQLTIAEAAGLQRVPKYEVPEGEHHWPYSNIFEDQMRLELGEDTQVRIRAQAPPSLWVHAPSLGPDWIRVPLYPHPLRGQRLWNLFGWFLGIGFLSTAAAWFFVSQLSAPLKRLVAAARQFGKGHSVRLPVDRRTASEIAEVYRAFNQMTDDIEQSVRERDLMLAGISHDLRTPLTRLRLGLELLDEDSELTQDMVRDIEDMDAIVGQFLAFIRDGNDEPLVVCDVHALVKEVISPYQQRGFKLNVQLAPVPNIELRRLSFKRLLVNLVENALRYGGDQIDICVTQENFEQLPCIVFTVADRGPGLSEADLEVIFNPFMRGEQARSGLGAGLGLAIVQRIAALHGGKVNLANRENGGLVAKVSLPLEIDQPRPKLKLYYRRKKNN